MKWMCKAVPLLETHSKDGNIKKDEIFLPHGIPIILGRTPKTTITDINCSRKQIILTADCKNCKISLKQIGRNPSGVNGFSLQKDTEVILGDGTYVEVILGKFIYVIKFSLCNNNIKHINNNEENLKRISENSNYPLFRPTKRKLNESDDSINLENYNKMSTSATLEKIDNGLMYIYTCKNVSPSAKIAGFDLDFTLIKTKLKNVFPKNIDDWMITYPEILSKLKSHSEAGYKIVIFTNQASIGKGKLKIEDFKNKLDNIIKKLNVPVQVFISTSKSLYRKPSTGMWDSLLKEKNCNINIDLNESFYCGDAAGRKTDHSHADRFFAENIGIKFVTPEMHFKNSKPIVYMNPSFDPKLIDKFYKYPNLIDTSHEILVMVGYPGSGKSHLAEKIQKDSNSHYKILCRDEIGSWQKCASEASKLIMINKSVIIDSTNPDIESRNRWVSLANKHKIKCRCILMDVTLSHSKHNNLFRQFTNKQHSIVTDMVYNSYKSKFKKPTLSEGFDDIIVVKFEPTFIDKEKEQLYYKHILEK